MNEDAIKLRASLALAEIEGALWYNATALVCELQPKDCARLLALVAMVRGGL